MTAATTMAIADTAALFHALSDPTRLRIVALLQGGERCVCELMEELDAAQSRLSFHLRTLKDAGIVNDRRDGRWVYYTLDRATLRVVEDVVKALRVSVPERRRLATAAAPGAVPDHSGEARCPATTRTIR